MRAQLDFLLQVGVGLLEPGGHVVELIGERLDLVASFDRDALAEVATADARRARAQCLDRYYHAPGEEHAGAEGERERSKEDQTGPLKRGIKRRVGLLDRRFDKHQP